MVNVSVIIPNYNHSSFLGQRIDTVLSQTYQDFEVIILDDCSIDKSRDIIEQYRKHPKVSHIVYNDRNLGSPFKQWKKGIELAQGEWIWIAESDDWCEKTFLEEIFDGINNFISKEISICFTQTYIYYNTSGELKVDYKHKPLIRYFNGEEVLKNIMLPRPKIINASMAIFKKEYYFNIPKDFENYKYCGDWLFWIEIGKMGGVLEIGKVLNFFRFHENNTYRNTILSGKNYLEELNILNQLNHESASKEVIKKAGKEFYYYYLDEKKFIPNSIKKNINILFSNILNSRDRFSVFFLRIIIRLLKVLRLKID